MAKKYCKYCSERCPNTALCVLVLMGEYLLEHTQSQESTDVPKFLTIPPLIIPPDEP
jgi:formate hydrogenlyase subunit 6/NADH:ubiquinone oxidoreductase subunit I